MDNYKAVRCPGHQQYLDYSMCQGEFKATPIWPSGLSMTIADIIGNSPIKPIFKSSQKIKMRGS